jgi:hypothetical protein
MAGLIAMGGMMGSAGMGAGCSCGPSWALPYARGGIGREAYLQGQG